MQNKTISVYDLCTLRELCTRAISVCAEIGMAKSNHVVREDSELMILHKKAMDALSEYKDVLWARFGEGFDQVNHLVEIGKTKARFRVKQKEEV